MSLSAVEKIFKPGKEPESLDKPDNDSWLEHMTKSMADNRVENRFEYSATVHPCLINGKRVLVYEKGLSTRRPRSYANLSKFAEENNFLLKEDERNSNRPVKFERRMAKTMPLLFLASGIFMSSMAAADPLTNNDPAVEVMPEIEVKAKRNKNQRAFRVQKGKRFVTDPYGDVESILTVASETKRQGKLKRISTRGITMPQNYAGGVINRYDYQFPGECGGGKFSYYEGEGFGALGYHNGKTVILDVMIGGGPFTAPQLWGPYDQVLGDRHNVSMKLMMGNGKKDGMGLLKASYAIGMAPVMPRDDYERIGNAYVNAVQKTASCMQVKDKPTDPVIRQAKNEW